MNINQFGNIIFLMTINELKLKYKRSVLGFFWSVLNPLLSISVISLVFSSFMGNTFKEYFLIVFPSLLVWNLFSVGLLNSANSLIINEHILKKVKINKEIFVIASYNVVFIEFILNYIFLYFLSVILFGVSLHFHIFYFLLLIIGVSMFTIGLGFIFAILVPKYRDIYHLLNVFLQFLFYLSPILYETSKLSTYPFLIKYNLIRYFVDLSRKIVDDSLVKLSINEYIIVLLISLLILILGYIVFRIFKKNIFIYL